MTLGMVSTYQNGIDLVLPVNFFPPVSDYIYMIQ